MEDVRRGAFLREGRTGGFGRPSSFSAPAPRGLLLEPLNETEALGDHRRVVVDREGGVPDARPKLVASPEIFVRAAPRADGFESFTLTTGVLEVHLADSDHPDVGRLDHRDASAERIDDGAPAAWAGKLLTFTLVLDDER